MIAAGIPRLAPTAGTGALHADVPGLESRSPIDGSLLGVFSETPESEIQRWESDLRSRVDRGCSRSTRSRAAHGVALDRVLARRADEVADILVRESGKPIVQAFASEILPTRRALGWLSRQGPRILAPRRIGWGRRREWQPHGVVGMLSPWNYPLFLTLPSLAAALLAGNSVLWKPSELALATSHLILELLQEAGLGERVRMVVGGPGAGRAVADAGCDFYLLTGGLEMGREVLARVAAHPSPAIAELSGSDPMLVLEDADLERAARSAVWARMLASGQTCMAPRRILVAEAVAERFESLLEHRVRELRLGDPHLPDTEVGPLRTAVAADRAAGIVEQSAAMGARVRVGGHRLPGTGLYFQPTLLTDCSDDMPVFTEDVFAPILTIGRFAGVEDACRRVRRFEGGLTASVWTRSRRRGLELVRSLPGGIGMVNELIFPVADPRAPFGGVGRSGYGVVGGEEGLRSLARPRVISVGGGWPNWDPHLRAPDATMLRILRALAGRWGAAGTDHCDVTGRPGQAVRGVER